MIEIEVKKGDLYKAHQSLDLSMNNFKDMSDVLYYVRLSKQIETELTSIDTVKKSLIEIMARDECNKIIKDNVEHWTQGAANKIESTFNDIYNETIVFSLEPIPHSKLLTYPPTMGQFIKVFYAVFEESTATNDMVSE